VISGDDGAKSQGSTTVENETPEENRRIPAGTRSNARQSLSTGAGLSAKPRRMSRSPAKQISKGESGAGVETGIGQEFQEIMNPFEKGGLRRSPIASQEVEAQETNFNPFQRRGLRRSPQADHEPPTTEEKYVRETKEPKLSTISKSALNTQDTISTNPLLRDDVGHPAQQTEQSRIRSHQEEPELPPILKQSGNPNPDVSPLQGGVHDIPSSRARRSKDLAKKIQSSPLKPKLQRVSEPTKEANLEHTIEPEPEDSRPEKPKRRKSARFSIPEDPHAAKKKLRDGLLKELQQLQVDIALANQENRRLQLHYESKRSPPNAPSNSDELLSLFVRSTAPEPPPKVDAIQNSAFKSIGSFLPFSSRRKRVSRTLPAFDKPIPSHLPIDVDNPLPYLQAFSPLTYSSKITVLPTDSQASGALSNIPSQEAQSIYQQHLITASHFAGLFTARLSMIVNTSLLSISSVDIERLPPYAEKELGTFLRERFTQNGALTKDIGLICWAMGRWVEVSVLRARFWCAVENELGSPEARAKSLQKKKKRKRRQVIEEDDDEAPLDLHEEEGFKKQKWTRRQLLPHMGRTAVELATDKVELRIEWRIKFDWTGEVDSSITASSRLPKSCKLGSVFSSNQ
jgi:hypothetical protein